MNKKIKNATPSTFNGITFRSKLEARIAKYLYDNNISYKYEAVRFELLPSLKYNGKTLRAVHYTPDFICDNFIIEVKGFPNDSWGLKKKLIVHHLVKTNSSYKFREVHSISELIAVIKEYNYEHQSN